MHGGNIYENKVLYDFSVNINPFGCGKKVRKAVKNAVTRIGQYPDLENRRLKAQTLKMIREQLGDFKAENKFSFLPENLSFGNGASELLLAIIKALNVQSSLLISPCFSGYEYALNAVNSKVDFCSLEAESNFAITESVLNNIEKKLLEIKPQLLILTNPNNPNGKFTSLETVEKIADLCKRNGCYFLLDECFIELTGYENQSFIQKLWGYQNTIVLRSFTKSFAIPGVRLGYCFSESKIAEKINLQLPEWNISVFAEEAGAAACSDFSFVKESVRKICKERSFLKTSLEGLGLKVFDSDSNFLLFCANLKGDFTAELMKDGILIRDCRDYKNLSKGYYRIAVKSHSENAILIDEIKRLVNV